MLMSNSVVHLLSSQATDFAQCTRAWATRIARSRSAGSHGQCSVLGPGEGRERTLGTRLTLIRNL